VIDAERRLGIMVGAKAMRLAIEKARRVGVGVVTVYNSGHFGAIGHYAMQAAEQGMVGVCFTGAGLSVVPTFAAKPLLGTNPIALAAPARHEAPMLFDAATSATVNELGSTGTPPIVICGAGFFGVRTGTRSNAKRMTYSTTTSVPRSRRPRCGCGRSRSSQKIFARYTGRRQYLILALACSSVLRCGTWRGAFSAMPADMWLWPFIVSRPEFSALARCGLPSPKPAPPGERSAPSSPL
jgi:hypothetical protein